MRNVPYPNRIRSFINTHAEIRNLQYGNSPIIDHRRDPYNSFESDFSEITIDDLRDIWSSTTRGYLQNFGMTNVEPYDGWLDGIRMYHSEMPAFGIVPPVSYRTPEELSNGRVPMYTFSTDYKAFDTKQDLIDYLVGQLIQDYEIFIHSIDKGPLMYDPTNFNPIRKWLIRLKVVNWGEKLGRTNFNFPRFKKDFTPSKILPKFEM